MTIMETCIERNLLNFFLVFIYLLSEVIIVYMCVYAAKWFRKIISINGPRYRQVYCNLLYIFCIAIYKSSFNFNIYIPVYVYKVMVEFSLSCNLQKWPFNFNTFTIKPYSRTNTYTYICTYCTHLHTCIHTSVHTYAHYIFTYLHTYIHTPFPFPFLSFYLVIDSLIVFVCISDCTFCQY